MNVHSTPEEALRAALNLAGHAPSLFNAKPWSWRVGTDSAELFLDTTRSFPVTDPDRREMTIGCGAALHHLLVVLAAAGWRCHVERSSGREGGLLARVRLTEVGAIDEHAQRLAEAIPHRHTDRRPFSEAPVSAGTLAGLQESADGQGVHVQIVATDEDRIWLSLLTERAAVLQGAQEGYADELDRVTGADNDSAGVAADVVPHVVSPRHSDVSLRDFELSEPGTMQIPESTDEHPTWCILWTDRDETLDWLEAGVAMSEFLLTASADGLAAGVQSQPIEVPIIRAQVNDKLLSNLGYAQVLVRIGWPGTAFEMPSSPQGD